MIMKKIFSLVFIFLICLSLFSCDNTTTQVTMIVPVGTPFLAVGSLLENKDLQIEAVSGTENLTAALSSGSHDIVIAPINLGSTLYLAEKSKYQIASVITMNNAYIVTKASNKLDGIDDLVGKNIVGFGKKGVPGSLLKHLYQTEEKLDYSILENNDNWYSSGVEVYGLFKGGTVEYALMSEPEISSLILNDKIEVNTLNLCELLDKEIVPQACVFINPNSTKQEEIKNILELIQNNISYLNENPEGYADKIIPLHNSFKSMGKEVIVRSIPLTSIVYVEASSIKKEILDILLLLDPTNSRILDEKFYYQK